MLLHFIFERDMGWVHGCSFAPPIRSWNSNSVKKFVHSFFGNILWSMSTSSRSQHQYLYTLTLFFWRMRHDLFAACSFDLGAYCDLNIVDLFFFSKLFIRMLRAKYQRILKIAFFRFVYCTRSFSWMYLSFWKPAIIFCLVFWFVSPCIMIADFRRTGCLSTY